MPITEIRDRHHFLTRTIKSNNKQQLAVSTQLTMHHSYPSRSTALWIFVTSIGAATGRPELFHVAPTNESCYDYFMWTTFDGNGCAYIESEIKSMNITDGSKCGYLGYFEDVSNGFSANEGYV